jgi:hypothetical protein
MMTLIIPILFVLVFLSFSFFLKKIDKNKVKPTTFQGKIGNILWYSALPLLLTLMLTIAIQVGSMMFMKARPQFVYITNQSQTPINLLLASEKLHTIASGETQLVNWGYSEGLLDCWDCHCRALFESIKRNSDSKSINRNWLFDKDWNINYEGKMKKCTYVVTDEDF